MQADESQESDDALMARIARGDRPAARELMRRRLPRILGLARRMLNDPVEAEDVAQDVFIRVWNAADRWEPGRAQLSSWISRIAMNLCYDRLRKRREILTDAPPEQIDGAPAADDALMIDEAACRLSAALAQLPDRQREAIELVHYQELGNIAAAEIMEVSVEAMESLLARGRRKLKAVLIEDKQDLLASYGQGAGQASGPASTPGSKSGARQVGPGGAASVSVSKGAV